MTRPLPLRIVFMGSPDFAVPALKALIDRPDLAQVVAVVSQTDKPRGRGQALMPPPVKEAALQHAIAVLQPKTLKDESVQAALREFNADLFVVAAYGKLLPQAVLDIPPLGCLNLHASLLPRHRGASPITQALLMDDAQSGVCLMGMEIGLDTGPVYARVETDISENDDAGTLTDRLAALSAPLLLEHLPALAAGTLKPVPQPADGVTYAGKLNKEDGRIAWENPVRQVLAHMRAYSPWPSAFTFVDGKRLQVTKAKAADKTLAPGRVAIEGPRLFVGCGDGAVELLEVKPEGKRAMPTQAYLAGRPPLQSGTNL